MLMINDPSYFGVIRNLVRSLAFARAGSLFLQLITAVFDFTE
jgi:hypothetical protein